MACRGVHFALSEEQEIDLLNAADDEAVIEVIEGIESEWNKVFLAESDKAWDAIHRCLTDGNLEYEGGAYPLSLVICGGKHLHKGQDYIVAFVSRPAVVDIADALSGITEAWLRERYFSMLDPAEYDGEIDEEDFEYTWSNLVDVRNLYGRAKESGRSVVFTVDQ